MTRPVPTAKSLPVDLQLLLGLCMLLARATHWLVKAATTQTVAASPEELYQIQKLLTQHVRAWQVIALRLDRHGMAKT